MDLKLFFTVFVTIFIAELGDKTQLATLLYAADAQYSRVTVFLAAALALITATALGVTAGALIGHWLTPTLLRWVSGIGFVAIGLSILFTSG